MAYDSCCRGLGLTETQIITDSYFLRIWMIGSILEGIPTPLTWYESMEEHVHKNRWKLVSWFKSVSEHHRFEDKNWEILLSLFPNKFLLGDAIRQVVKVFRFKPRPGIYVMNALSS